MLAIALNDRSRRRTREQIRKRLEGGNDLLAHHQHGFVPGGLVSIAIRRWTN